MVDGFVPATGLDENYLLHSLAFMPRLLSLLIIALRSPALLVDLLL